MNKFTSVARFVGVLVCLICLVACSNPTTPQAVRPTVEMFGISWTYTGPLVGPVGDGPRLPVAAYAKIEHWQADNGKRLLRMYSKHESTVLQQMHYEQALVDGKWVADGQVEGAAR